MNKLLVNGLYNEENKKVECLILSHGDLDGISSGVQVESKLNRLTKSFKAIYNMSTGTGTTDYMYYNLAKDLKNGGVIYVLDRTFFSYKKTIDMIRDNNHKIVYIDHHLINDNEADIINGAKHYGLFTEYLGGYSDVSTVMRTWTHLNDASPIKMVKAISDWDTFNWKNLPSDEQVLPKALKAWEAMSQMTSVRNYLYNVFSETIEQEELISRALACKEIYDGNCDDLFRFINDNQVGFELFKTNRKELETLTGYILSNKDIEYKFLSDVADMLINDQSGEKVDLVIWTDLDTISVRTTSRLDLKANEIAMMISSMMGGTGGGHTNAAGGKIKDRVSFETLSRVITSMTF